MATSAPCITKLYKSEIFVFGSNLRGRHGKGAALTAYANFGAVWGKGWGLWGRTFAIPTKDQNMARMSHHGLQWFIKQFCKFAKLHPSKRFLVTEIGCGLAGFSVIQISDMFAKCNPLSANVFLPARFHSVRNFLFE